MQIIQQNAFEKPALPLFKNEPLVVHRRTEGHNRAIVIFVHGLGGNRYTTWGEFPTFLFDDFANQDKFALDLGFYEYRTAFRRLRITRSIKLVTEAAVLADIIRDLGDYQKIIFIVHSEGGILVKAAIANLVLRKDPRARTALTRIAALIMMATPQAGSLWIPRLFSWINEDTRVLAPHSALLTEIAATFNEHVVSRTADYRSDRTLIPTWMVKAAEDMWVDQFSAGLGLAKEQQKLVRGSHTEIVKPSHSGSDAYRWVRDRIVESLSLDLSKLTDQALGNSVDTERELIDQISLLVGSGGPMLDKLQFIQGNGHGRGVLIAWLTEARQITKILPDRLDSYKSELTTTMGPDLGGGNVYTKARTVYEIMCQLLLKLRRK
jgi:pimeloyl-ACP methyl ester carboxylesterase